MIKLKHLLKEDIQPIDKQIYDLLSNWIISSLSDTQERQEIGKKLQALDIPNEYKQVPSDTLLRVGKPANDQKYISYSYDYRGLKKMISWMKKIFNRDIQDSDIIEVPINQVNVLICIPTFFKKTKLSSGRRFDALWKSEYEVIAIK